MGMFSSLFGSSGSDKADKMRQQALDAFNAVKTPELSSLQVQLQKAVVAGQITPEQAETQLLNSNAFNQIKTDPSLMGAQKQALQQLQDTASAGGLDAIDKSKLQDITDTQNQENKSSSDAIIANARARGMGNSNLSAVQRLIAEQGSADRAAKSGSDVAAQSQARALAALQSAGQLGGQMEGQQFGEQAQKAASQNAIDQFNAANKNDMTKFNTTNNLNAQGANVANAQNVENSNTGTQNAQILHNADANNTVFNDEMAKASGKAGVLNQWANDSTKQAATDKAGDASLTAGLVQAGAGAGGFAMGGPAGGAIASSAVNPPSSFAPTDESMLPGSKANPNAYANENQFSEGGVVGDSKPTSMEDEYHKFVQNFCNGGTVNMADGGKVTVKPGKKDPMPMPTSGATPTPPLPITSAENKTDWNLTDPNDKPIGQFSNYPDAAAFAEKVRAMQPHTEDFRDGGKVPGKALVPGDSPKNDIVPAKLSPDEVVASRTEAQNFEKKTGTPLEEALKRLKNPAQIAAARG